MQSLDSDFSEKKTYNESTKADESKPCSYTPFKISQMSSDRI